MQVEFNIMIGQDRDRKDRKFASKTVELDFVPMIGMFYQDGTWKSLGRADEGKQIVTVVIMNRPVEDKPFISVTLKPDEDATADALKGTYEAWKWSVAP